MCVEFQQYLCSAEQAESPKFLAGLTEIGKRVRVHQRQERLRKAQADLQRHQNVCPEAKQQSQPA
jgi:hypothetical protein